MQQDGCPICLDGVVRKTLERQSRRVQSGPRRALWQYHGIMQQYREAQFLVVGLQSCVR